MPRKRKEIIKLIQQAGELKTPALDLSACSLGDLIEEVCQMTWLKELNLAHCHLGNLPDSVGNLVNLKSLNLSENQLPSLPEAICRLENLQHLDLTRAGYQMSVSETVSRWLETVSEVIWPEKPQPEETINYAAIGVAHPNNLLGIIKGALDLYGVALAMEDRSFGGGDKRAEADAPISAIFRQLPELQEILPEFYSDFQRHSCYSVNCESEKTLDNNPFQLPTEADDRWLAEFKSHEQLLPLRLQDKLAASRRDVSVFNFVTKQETEVFSSEYGRVFISNDHYAEDEEYLANCEATLFQAGSTRLYLKALIYGYGGIGLPDWYSSNDGGLSWQKQARLTYEWLKDKSRSWPELAQLKALEI